MFIHQE